MERIRAKHVAVRPRLGLGCLTNAPLRSRTSPMGDLLRWSIPVATYSVPTHPESRSVTPPTTRLRLVGPRRLQALARLHRFVADHSCHSGCRSVGRLLELKAASYPSKPGYSARIQAIGEGPTLSRT